MHAHLGRRALLSLGLVAALLGTPACQRVGPRVLRFDRYDYGASLADSWQRETLLNVVRLRYSETPMFLSVAQIISGYQFESSLSLGFSAAEALRTLNFGGTANGQTSFIDRPTTVYVPLTGIDFIKHLMEPIPPSALLRLIQAGYDASLILRMTAESINGHRNAEVQLDYARPRDPTFARAVELIHHLQRANATQLRVQRTGDVETSAIHLPPPTTVQADADTRELMRLLRLDPTRREFPVVYGGLPRDEGEIAILTRSMLRILGQLAWGIDVPEKDAVAGRTYAPPAGVTAARKPGAQAGGRRGAPRRPRVLDRRHRHRLEAHPHGGDAPLQHRRHRRPRLGPGRDHPCPMTDPAIGTLGSQTGLALERTRLAYERTMMAWVRTAISLITFGFTIYKFFQLEIAPPARAHVVIGPREFALVLIALALASLGTGAVQHRRALQTLRRLEPALASSSALGLAVVVWMLGVAALVAVWLRL
jgi:uncharacterized membrane protein YidH (DUF202 family)